MIAVHPGVVVTGKSASNAYLLEPCFPWMLIKPRTDGAQHFFKTMPLRTVWIRILRLFTVTPDQGARTSLFAAASPTVRANPGAHKGAYVVPYGKVEQPNANARNSQLAKDLWESSEVALAEFK